MVKFIESELTSLKKEVNEMWTLVYNQLDRAGESVLTFNRDLAQQVIVREKRVNAFELKIDSDVEDIIAHNQDVIVIVDEAYIDFAGKSALELIDKYENLIVVQTFSKSRSLAGARVGFAIANPELIADMNRIKYSFNPYNVNRLSILAGAAAMRDWDYTKECTGRICKTREKTTEALRALGFTVLPSSANFVFATHKTIPAKEIFENAREHKIFVRYFDKPRIDNYLRISIGTDAEMDAFVAFLKGYVETKQN